MKFLFTVASYYPVTGGVQVATQNTAEELVRQGHEVTVLISRNNGIQEYDKLNGVQLIYYDLYTQKDRIVGNKATYVHYLLELSQRFDVLINVSVHSAMTDAVMPYIHKFKCKTVLYLHGIYEFGWSAQDKSSVSRILSKIYYNTRRRFFYANMFRYAKNYDLIVHLSENDISLAYMKKHGITQNIVIHNSAERAFFEPPKKECDGKYFLQVANYAEHKNQEFSLRAFYQANCPDIKMIYIGSQKNNYLSFLIQLNESLKKEYGERGVEFLVNVSRQETIEYFKHARAVILSSRVEKFPMVLVEGAACRVPFISTDCGCVRSLEGGYVVTNVNEMRIAMEKLASDDSERCRLGNIAHQHAIESYSLEQNITKLVLEISGRNI